MRAVRLYGVGDLRVEDVEDPGAPAGDQVRLRVEMAGICGSDLHNYRTGIWISRAPSTPGHEFVATVEAVGPAVAALAPGDRVVADSRVPCGTCPSCRAGKGYLCAGMGFVGEVNDGGFAPVTVLPERQVLRLPDQTVPAAVAAMAEPLAVALHAINRLAAPAGAPVLVMGAGPIGALSALVLGHRGHPVVLAEPNAARRALVSEVAGAAPGGPAPGHLAHAIDTTGAPAALAQALETVARGGRLAVVGLYHGSVPVDLNRVVEGGLEVAGCAAFDGELEEAVALLAPLADRLAALGGAPVALEAVPAAYGALIAGGSAVVKQLVDPAG